jgi:hypothetical protein
MLLSKVKKEIMLSKPSPRPLSAVAVEISSSRKPVSKIGWWR